MSTCKCEGEGCDKLRFWCYRYRKIGTEYQPYSKLYNPHPSDERIKCTNYIPIKDRTDISDEPKAN